MKFKRDEKSTEERELIILRNTTEKLRKAEGIAMLKDPRVKEIINIVESFITEKDLVGYGGTAINALLPKKDQFYDSRSEFPDYDFFSPNALADAKKLADIYFKAGYTNVVAKAGVHQGTFKVFVNYIPVADITHMVPELFKSIKKSSVVVKNMRYCSPDYLRMLMYLELSRPKGDISRWEKVLDRISLLNKNFPLRGRHCGTVEIQRSFGPEPKHKTTDKETIFYTTRSSLTTEGVVFFGASALQLYLRKLTKFKHDKFKNIPDFDVLSTDPKGTAEVVKKNLIGEGIENVNIRKMPGIGGIIYMHYEITVGKDTIAMVYKTLACHSYNEIKMNGWKIKIASIPTMLSLYLAFMHVDRPYYDSNRILCMSEFLFKIQQNNRTNRKGILRRFTEKCYGEQETINKMREKKAELFEKYKKDRSGREWENNFLRYLPDSNSENVELDENDRGYA